MRATLEGAAGLCLARTHYDVEIEHFLTKLLDASGTDFAGIVQHFGVDKARLAGELGRSLDGLKSGNARTPAFSPSLVRMLRESWTIGSLEFGAGQVRSGAAILALVSDEELSRLVLDVSKEFRKIEPEALRKVLPAILADSREYAADADEAPASGAGAPATAKAGGKTQNLDQFTVNLTENARKGKIDTVLGRDFEIRQMVDILTRRRQNNPILTGEAGVGKTAVVEGFAQRTGGRGRAGEPAQRDGADAGPGAIAGRSRHQGRVREPAQGVGGGSEVVSHADYSLHRRSSHHDRGGRRAGQNDAANILKPALARGELRTIAATTWSEYKKYFEKDPALARRFQVVKVEEPTEAKCQVMLRGLVPVLEKHHNVRILDEGLVAAVKFSHRYLPDRQLPDKAVSVLDTACARLALGQSATPPAIEDATRQIDDCAVQTRILERESALGADHSEGLAALAKHKAAVESRLAELKGRWEKERDLVGKIRDVRGKLEAASGASGTQAAGDGAAVQTATDPGALRQELAALNTELEQLQGESPLMRVCVDSQIVGEVVAAWTGIPIGKMLRDEMQSVLTLEATLGKRVIGQNHALDMLSERIRTSKAGLEDPGKPIGVFLLVGPSGVGKTETALALADLLYGGERNMITINMSEFQEAHTVSTLKGSPPGYVGYGEGGVLTEAVRRRPYSVVLLDEVEKAHPDVLELFFQVFDKGRMEDGEGREIDFKNTIIILTSNAGTDTLMKLTADAETMPSPAGLVKALKPELDKVFKPAFLGRLVIVPYFPVRDEALKLIVRLKLGKIQRRIQETHRIALTHDEALIDEVAKRCTEVESGARNVDNILTNTLLPQISRQILERLAERQKLEAIHVTVGDDGVFVYN